MPPPLVGPQVPWAMKPRRKEGCFAMDASVPRDRGETGMAVRNARFLLSVVVPVYNEEDVIRATHRELVSVLGGREAFGLEIVYVNDGSSDASESILNELAETEGCVRVVSFSRNFGHQPAVSAGLCQA